MNSAAIKIALAGLAVGLYAWQALAPADPSAEAAGPSPEQIAALSQKVKTLFSEDRYRDALEPAKKLVAAYPDNELYLDRLATVYHHLNRPSEEAEQWERYMMVSPTPEDACAHLDHAYQALHDRTRQTSAAERCLAHDGRNPDFIFTVAHLREMAGDFKTAAELYERGIRLAPEDFDLQIGLGRARLHMGHTREALALAEWIVRERPDNADALLLLGMCRWSAGDNESARKALERGVAVAENYADIHFLLGRVAEAEHQEVVARAQYQRVLQLEPDNRQARQLLARLGGVNQ